MEWWVSGAQSGEEDKNDDEKCFRGNDGSCYTLATTVRI